MKEVLFLGDSLTAGYGLRSPHVESLPSLLAQKAVEAGKGFNFINAGISGDTTSSALLRVPKLIDRPLAIVVIALGANDMLRGYSAVTMAKNLELIIIEFKQAYPVAKILLLGMELPAWITAQRATQYRDIYSSLAKKYQLEFLPFLLEGVIGSRALNLPDMVHPNAQGYQIIAERVWPLLKQLL